MSVDDCPTNEIADLEKRLAELDRERLNILGVLEQLKKRAALQVQPTTSPQMEGALARAALSNIEKINLFRSLFRGRDDVFPRRWENSKSDKSGLLEARRNGQVPVGCEYAIELLVEECGLYPYVDASAFSYLTQTVIEAHAVTLRGKLYLHSKQMQILLWLLDGDNVILSAPTSFGKTLLVDAFLARAEPTTVVMILPTIALIDECRRRLLSTFGERYDIITTVSEIYDNTVPTIFVLTPERFLQRRDVLIIDFLFVDEFYKLDPTRGDARFETLNLALYKALPHARQCFMAGPHIRDIHLGERWTGNFRFVRTDYRTVTVNVIDRSTGQDKLEVISFRSTQRWQ